MSDGNQPVGIPGMTSVRDNLAINADFSPAIGGFFLNLMSSALAKSAPSCLFFRDFEQLPQRAPFDLDILCNRTQWQALLARFRQLAQQFDLLMSVRQTPKSTYVLLLDLAGPAENRRHCFFEIREDLDIPSDQFAVVPSLSRVMIASGDAARAAASGLPVPTPGWHSAFLILQALRKSQPDRYLAIVRGVPPAVLDEALGILGRYGFDATQLAAWLASPRPVAPRPRRQPATTWRDRIRIFCSRYLFFLPLVNHEFFSLHGPDGVGKTTTCLEIERLFAGLPLGLYMFHHSEGWKGARRRPEAAAGATPVATRAAAGPAAKPGPVHRLLRLIYRAMPEALQDLWIWNIHFIVYNRRFSQFLLRNRGHGEVLFSDRYLYDVRIKYAVETPHPKILVKAYYKLHCGILPRPNRAFILTDDPAAIARRKDELTETQIRRFLDGIREALRQHGVPTEEIAIEGRLPRAVALDIATRLLRRMDASVIDYVKAYMHQLEARSARG